MPLTGIRLWRKLRSSRRPGSSLPTIPTGSTLTPRSARLLTAFAPPPGTTVRSRCRRISTGASRDTREISPNTNSSATISPSTATVTRGNASMILRRWLVSCDVRGMLALILSRPHFAFANHAQHGIQSVSGFDDLHYHLRYRHLAQLRNGCPEIYGILLCGDKPAALVPLAQSQEVAHVLLRISVMIAVRFESCWCHARTLQLFKKIMRPCDAAEYNRPSWSVMQH